MVMTRSTLQLVVLLVLLCIEIGLVISLRTSGWLGTGQRLQTIGLTTALGLPVIISAVLLYRVRFDFRKRQFSLRFLLVIGLLAATILTLLPLFTPTPQQNFGPLPLANSATFGIYKLSAPGVPGAIALPDPATGGVIHLSGTPIIDESDIETVELLNGAPDHGIPSLLVVLTSQGGGLLGLETAKGTGKHLAFVANGKLISVPRILSPLGRQFSVDCFPTLEQGVRLFRDLTSENAGPERESQSSVLPSR